MQSTQEMNWWLEIAKIVIPVVTTVFVGWWTCSARCPIQITESYHHFFFLLLLRGGAKGSLKLALYAFLRLLEIPKEGAFRLER